MDKLKGLVLATATTALFSGCIDSGEDENQDNVDPNSTITITGNVTASETWQSATYILPREFRVQNTLTIEPCTTIKVGDRVWIEEGGSIEAIGEEDCPIVFTSTESNPSPGDWRHIEIAETASASTFEHVIFEYGGNSDGAVQVKGRAGFANVELRQMEETALRVHDDGRLNDFTDVSFQDLDRPLTVTPNEVASLESLTMANVTSETIQIRGPEMTRAGTWKNHNIPYEFSGNPNNDYTTRAALSVDAGTHFLLGAGFRLFVEQDGSLTTLGTEEEEVIFESIRSSPGAGDWMHIHLREQSDGGTLSYTTLRHGGHASALEGVLRVDAPVTLNNVTFEDNGRCDVQGDAELVTDTNTVFEGC